MLNKVNILIFISKGTYSWKMLFRLWLGYDDFQNNMVFLNLVDATGWLWMLRYFNDVINLAWIASVTIVTEEWLSWWVNLYSKKLFPKSGSHLHSPVALLTFSTLDYRGPSMAEQTHGTYIHKSPSNTKQNIFI